MTDTDQRLQVPGWTLLLCLLTCLAGILDHDLWTPDEPRDAAISLEMSRTGDWIIPRLAGEPFVEKPPLYFASAALVTRLAGPLLGPIGAIRMTTALWGLGTLLMTFWLARRLFDPVRARFSVAVLATMAGFVMNMHWIRVDAALVFFVAAAAWSFAEVYLGDRPWHCLPAGLFTAGAFLSKGVIGPLLVAVAWAGLAIPWLVDRLRAGNRNLFIVPHALCLACLAAPALAWMALLRQTGGPALWHEWFWENHFGRAMGTATVLGHIRPGEPFYYVETLAVYALPWLPGLVLWFASVIPKAWKQRSLSRPHLFLLAWSVGSVILLTVPATKRDIYLAPVLAAFALMTADAFSTAFPRWCRVFSGFWAAFCLLVLAAAVLSPLWGGLLGESVSPLTRDFLCRYSLLHVMAAVFLGLSLLLVLMRPHRILEPVGTLGLTALLVFGLFTVPTRALDLGKSMKNGVVSFASRIPPDRKPRVAAWNFCETSRGIFYFYCDWTLPRIHDRRRLLNIVAGRDPEFDSVIITREPSIPDLLKRPYRVLAEETLGPPKHTRTLHWVEGKNDAG